MSDPLKRSAIRYFGDYVLLGEIARGGMGVVYRALQTSLDREVALKMMDAGKLASESAVRRFQNEAEAMAKLDHANIISIYEIGEHDGQYYFAMKLVDGPNLADHIGNQPMEPRPAAELIVTVAGAVQYAHDRGVLHRDLKPSNILLDAQGRPHVTDFGIAKLVERGEGFTGTVAMLGTPEYMSPEQAAGKARQIGTAADTYSLGAILYFLLTGRAPFSGETPLEILDRVVKQEPASLQDLNPGVDPDLETICLKCLAKDVTSRYGTAADLALDLRRWLSSQPIAARPASGWNRGKKWARRHPGLLAACAALTFFAVLWSVLPRKWTESFKARGPSAFHRVFAGRSSSKVPQGGVVQGESPGALATNTLVADMTEPESVGQLPRRMPKPPELLVKLETTTFPNGYLKRTPSGVVREQQEQKPDGTIVVQYYSLTGRLQREDLQKPDGSRQATFYDLSGKVRRVQVSNRDGTQDITNVLHDRDGKPRVQETIKYDNRGKEISKTAVVKQTVAIVNSGKTIVNDSPTVVRNYDRGRFGFTYRPAYDSRSPVLVSWFDSYWYSPDGAALRPPFRYAWGWDAADWYRTRGFYWTTDPVYPAPSYWMTDWLIASYVADRYSASVSMAQAQEEIRLARDDAGKARLVAQQARDAAELAEAQAAQTEAEARAAKAQIAATRAEAVEAAMKSQAGRPNPQATPIDQPTKENLRTQIEKEIVTKKAIAAQLDKGGRPAIPDLAQSLADPQRLYLVSKAVSVTRAQDGKPAGTLTEGDLLRLEPGQQDVLKGATENTLIAMRVLTSKGEEGEVLGGTLISIPLRELQNFDSEFRAKVDLGLAEADRIKDLFRRNVQP